MLDDPRSDLEWAEPDGLSRRELLARAATIGVVLALPAAGTATVGFPAVADAAPTKLSLEQRAMLEAIVDRLVPADETGPSGTEMGVSAYIERGLAGGLMGGLKATAPLYKAGLAMIDKYSLSAYGVSFLALTPADQDSVLSAIETGKPTTPGTTPGAGTPQLGPEAATFFATLHEHTVQGMFCDPAYGGNKGFAGWDLVGYPGVRMPVPASYQEIGAKVPKAHKSTYSGGALGVYAHAKKEAIA
jgi:gluconate 2-dehydrogenase gamma chain